MEELPELYSKCMEDIKNTKSKFGKIIKFINENTEINGELSPDIKIHLKKLIKLWKNNADANIEYYFNMKDHHSYINGNIENDTLKIMWDDYIESGLKFRVVLMKLNHMCSEKYK
uniref:Uncharacterized protein n=1 Tax=viral metagenome TaxID=1070528 RepID=A0A6C0CEA2_9ZZZZ